MTDGTHEIGRRVRSEMKEGGGRVFEACKQHYAGYRQGRSAFFIFTLHWLGAIFGYVNGQFDRAQARWIVGQVSIHFLSSSCLPIHERLGCFLCPALVQSGWRIHCNQCDVDQACWHVTQFPICAPPWLLLSQQNSVLFTQAFLRGRLQQHFSWLTSLQLTFHKCPDLQFWCEPEAAPLPASLKVYFLITFASDSVSWYVCLEQSFLTCFASEI